MSFLKGLLHNDCFGNLNMMESIVTYLLVFDQRQFLLHNCILVLVIIHLVQVKT